MSKNSRRKRRRAKSRRAPIRLSVAAPRAFIPALIIEDGDGEPPLLISLKEQIVVLLAFIFVGSLYFNPVSMGIVAIHRFDDTFRGAGPGLFVRIYTHKGYITGYIYTREKPDIQWYSYPSEVSGGK